MFISLNKLYHIQLFNAPLSSSEYFGSLLEMYWTVCVCVCVCSCVFASLHHNTQFCF